MSSEPTIEGTAAGSCATTVPAELIDVVDAIDKALQVDWALLEPEVMRSSLLVLTAARNQLDALDAMVVDAADEPAVFADAPDGGSATLRSWLYKNTNCHRGALAGRTSRADKLAVMPHVRDAFEAGHITADHVRLLGELTAPRFYEHFVDDEVQLVEWATVMAFDDFKVAIAAWRTAADSTEPELKDEKDHEARSVSLTRGWKERGDLVGTLTPAARVTVHAELRRITKILLKHDRAEAMQRLGRTDITNADLLRSDAQRRHDALVMMAERSNGADPTAQAAPPLVYIRATDACAIAALKQYLGLEPDLVPVADFECEFDDGTPISYEQLADFLLRGHLRAVVMSAEGEVLHYGKGRRWFTPAQKEAANYRDRVCACGCGLPARLVDADHDVPWPLDGLTDIDNLVPRCRTTHTRKTATENRRRRLLKRRRQLEFREIHEPSTPGPPPPTFGTRPSGSSESDRSESDRSETDRSESESSDVGITEAHSTRPTRGPTTNRACPLDPDLDAGPLSRTIVNIDFANRYYPGEQRW